MQALKNHLIRVPEKFPEWKFSYKLLKNITPLSTANWIDLVIIICLKLINQIL